MKVHPVFLAVTSATLMTLTSATWTYEGTMVTLALVNYTYRDPRRDGIQVEVGQVGKYAPGQVASASGRVVAGSGGEAGQLKCQYPWSPPAAAPTGPWVALVPRGKCSDMEKVKIAVASNASAVIIYSSDPHAHLRKITVESPEFPVVWLGEEEGRGLAGVVGVGGEVVISLSPGHHLRYHVTSVNRQTLGQRFVASNPLCEAQMYPADCFIVTSVLFVSVSFIILMAISLAWLIFYYVQRFRYIHAKDRLARHLCNAAKKALAKIPVKNLKPTDKEVVLEGECCAVCIEHYQVGEAIRTLPCKHQFHRCCVDPWLLEHRTCPMCKMDILKHYGYVFSGSTETVLPIEEQGFEMEINLSESEESVMQLDLGDGGEGGLGGVESPLPLPLDPHSPRTAANLPPVTLTSRTEGEGGRGGVGGRSGGIGACWGDGGVGGAAADTPHGPIHSPTPHPSLCSLLTPSRSSPSLTSAATSSGGPPSTPDMESPVFCSPLPPPTLAGAVGCAQVMPVPVIHAQVQDEAGDPTSDPPTPPKRSRSRKRSSDVTPSLAPPPAGHVVSVSHF